MSEPRTPGDVPPDLPPEYAEAYRRGYERAYQEAVTGTSPVVEPDTEPRVHETDQPADDPGHEPVDEEDGEPVDERTGGAHAAPPPLFADELEDDAEPTHVLRLTPGPVPPAPEHETTFAPEPLAFGQPRATPSDEGRLADDLVSDEAYDDEEDRERPGWWVPALLVGLVLLLVLGAYGIGRVFSSSVGDADVSTEEPDGVVLGDGGDGGAETGEDGPSGKPRDQQADAYQGRTELATIGGATGTCQAPASVDAAGNEVGYPPANTYDGDLTTAWRCNGTGVGQSLTLTLAEAGDIGEVGLVPGYAKTDPRSGVDRYAENNRITRVRWTFADGTSVVQRLDGTETNRELQTLRIPVTQSDSVVLDVLASTRGPRNTMAVSEVRVGRAVE